MTDFIISDDYDGVRRRLYPKKCPQCQKTFWVPKYMLKRRKNCSVKCLSRAKSK